MNKQTKIPADEPIIIMTRVYDAPRALVWEAMTDPKHVRRWWGGEGVENPLCEMDLRPGGRWKHVMRFPNGDELHMDFVFLEVEAPSRLVWQQADRGKRTDGPPTSVTTVTLDDLGEETRFTMIARFETMADREAAIAIGFTKPIEASNDRLVEYLRTMGAS